MHILIFHVISKSHPLWQVHAQSHLPRHIKIPPPVASTCTVSSYTSYQNPTPSGKYMHSHILHVISKSHPLWASTCTVSSCTSYQNPTPCGKYMHSLILHIIEGSLEVKLPTIWTDEKQSRAEAERRERLEERRSERVRRKKMQVREKVGKSRNTVFFGGFVAPEG